MAQDPREGKKTAAVKSALAWAGVVAVVIFGGILFWAGSNRSPQPLLDPENAELLARGGALYAAHCATCHGDNLEGQPDWQKRLASGRLPAPPHDETGHTWHHPDAVLFALTKYGLAAVIAEDYDSDMPAYEGVLSDEEIIAVLSYIKSRWPADVQAKHDNINAQYQRAR
ncbi:MAG: c-type cytochrome [Pseudomonadota bacterium]